MRKLIYILAGMAAMVGCLSIGNRAHASGVGDAPIPVGDALEVKEETGIAQDSLWTSVSDAFLLIPDKDLDILAQSQRNEMVIYMHADSVYKCRNVYTGLSWIEDMTQDYMRVHLTDVSSLQLKILPTGKLGTPTRRLVMSIYTISGESDTADSTIKFYNLTKYTPDSITLTEVAARKYFTLPNPECFYNVDKIKAEGMKLKTLMAEMPFHTVAYTIPAEGNLLTGRLTIDNYLTTEQRDRMNPLLIKTLRWRWTGKKFEMER
ncbi:MAG: DUF3256 family protein [Muribaculaceae bacterium]|nr:DUF3256 family protein [Muribaculaceae bacterium]